MLNVFVGECALGLLIAAKERLPATGNIDEYFIEAAGQFRGQDSGVEMSLNRICPTGTSERITQYICSTGDRFAGEQ